MSDFISKEKLIEAIKQRMKLHEKDAENLADENFQCDSEELFLRLADECQAIVELIEEQPKVSEWIPCSEKMPENAKYKGAFCPKYSVATKYGETIGWYNPDHESWYILIWFMTERFLETEINLEKGDIPKLLKVLNETNVVYAWQPLPEPYMRKKVEE